jgi:hypothetical protein
MSYPFDYEDEAADESFGAPDIGRQNVLARFIEKVRYVWSNAEAVLPQIEILLGEDQPFGKGVLAGIVYSIQSRPEAIGQHLLRFPTKAVLLVADELLLMDDAAIDRVLIHEACHLGYPRHTKEFFTLCRQLGGAVTSHDAKENNIQVQQKVGARYQTIKTFPSDEEAQAIAWARLQMSQNPGRYRLSM